MERANRLAVKLKTAAEKKVKQGHPWVYSDSIEKVSSSAKRGDLAILFGRQDNKIYGIGLYDTDSPIRIKVIHFGGARNIDELFFRQKINEAFSVRKALLRTKTNAYRLIFGENDGFPGIIADVYHQTVVLKLYTAAWLPYLPFIASNILEILDLKGVVLRLSRNLQQLNLPVKEGTVLTGELPNSVVRFEEYGIQFQADVVQGHKTGFFLDHRENRRRVGEMAKGKTVLDVFAYSGGFSVHALANGAKEVYSLDFSLPALKQAQENVRLNFSVGKHHILQGDAFSVLEQMVQEKKQFDIVIIDPPSFAKSKAEIEIALEKYAVLTRLGIALTSSGGTLLLASCSSRIKKEDFYEIHREELRRAGRKYVLTEKTEHALDHPVILQETAYLKTGYYQVF